MLGGNGQVGTSPEDDFAYGEGIPADATWRNLIPAAELGLSIAPGSGEAMAARDAWDASGRGGQALTEGRLKDALGEYLGMGTALAGAVPGAGIIARGTKRGTKFMDENLPEWINKGLDRIMPSDPERTFGVFVPAGKGPEADRARNIFDEAVDEIGWDKANRRTFGETGRLFGPEGALMREVRDNPNMRIKGDFTEGENLRLDQVIDHPELFDEYPEFQGTRVRFETQGTDKRKYTGVDPKTGDIIIDPSFKGNDLRVQLSKLLQYNINESENWVNAAREGAQSKLGDAQTALANVQKAIDDGIVPEAAGREYMDSLRNVMDEGESLRTAAQVEPGSYGTDIGMEAGRKLSARDRKVLQQKFWTDRSAGKLQVKAVKARAYNPERTGYPFKDASKKMDKAAVIPQANLTGSRLADFIENWQRYGQGRKGKK